MTDFGQIRRRRLVAIATAKFDSDQYGDLPEVADEVSHITAWLTDERLGDRRFTPHYQELAADPTRQQIEARFRDTPEEDQWNGADAAVVYITGHGMVREAGARRQHLLVLRKTDNHLSRTALSTQELLDWFAETSIEYLLVIIDVCFAGQVAEELMGMAKEHWLILPSAMEDQRAKPGVLARAIADYISKAAQFNRHSPYLTVGLFVDSLNQMLPTDQRVEEIYKGKRAGKAREPGSCRELHVCLPNPAYEPDDDLVRTEPWRQALALPADYLRVHNRVDGRLPAPDSPGWLFTGRPQLMRQLIRAAAEPGITMVTGSAGSGKSTALARLVTLSDPDFRRHYGRELKGVPADLLPARGAVDVAVSARGQSILKVLTQICYDLGCLGDVGSMDDPLLANRNALSSYLRHRKTPVTIVIDALDEATDPAGLVTSVLSPLSLDHREYLRVLVGVRSPAANVGGGAGLAAEESVLDLLGALDAQRITVDEDSRQNQRDITTFAANILTNTRQSPYKKAHHRTVTRVAEAISGIAGRSYLMAALAAESTAKSAAVVAADDPAWRSDLEEGILGVFRRDLRSSLRTPARMRWGITLLRAAAFARGNGLPRYLVWPEVATAVDAAEGAGYRYGDTDVRDLLAARLNAYLVIDEEDDLTVYRVIHDELRDILRYRWRELLAADGEAVARADEDEIREVEARIAARLGGEVGHKATVAASQPAPPYIRRHLAEHAVAGDVLDDCVPIPSLPSLDLPRLRSAVGASPVRGKLTESVPWLRVIQQMIHVWDWYRPARNAAAIEMWAMLNEAELPGSGKEPGPVGGPWQVLWARGPLDMGNVLGQHKDVPLAVATAELPDGPVAVSGGADGLLHVWDLSTGATYRDREPKAAPGETGQDGDIAAPTITCVTTTRLRSGRTVAVTGSRTITGSKNGAIRVWDLLSGRVLGGPLGDGSVDVEAVTTAVLPDGRVVVSAADTAGTVRTWDLDSRQAVGNPLPCGGPGTALGLATTLVGGRLVGLATGEDSGLQLWDVATGDPIGQRLTGHPLAEHPATGTVQGGRAVAAVILDGTDIALTGNGDGLLLWDIRAAVPIAERLRGSDGTIRALATERVGDLVVAVTGGNRAVQVWDLAAREPIGELLAGHDGTVEAVAIGGVSGASAFALSASRDASVRMWDVPGAARSPRRPSQEIGIVESVTTAQPPHGNPLAITCGHTVAQVWDLERGGEPLELTGYDSPVVSLAAAELPGGVLVVGGHWDGTISTWRAADGTLVQRGQLMDFGPAASLATAMLDGRLLALVGDWDGTVHVWDPLTAVRAGEPLPGHADVVAALATATTADGRTLVVSGGRDGYVLVRDLGAHVDPGNPAPREPVTVSIDAAVASLTITQLADGQSCVVVGGGDGTIHLLGLLNGAPLAEPWPAASAAVAAGRLPDGRMAVFTGGAGSLVQVWDASTGEPILEALPVPGPVLALAFETGTSSLVVGGTGVAVARPRLGG